MTILIKKKVKNGVRKKEMGCLLQTHHSLSLRAGLRLVVRLVFLSQRYKKLFKCIDNNYAKKK